jgi:fused signal recognition particle receptor
MFAKLKDKLKKWTKKVSGTEELLEEKSIKEPEKKDENFKKIEKDSKKEKKSKKKEKQDFNEDIDSSLKKEVSKKKYKEPEKKFNSGTLSHEPDLEKSQEEFEEIEEKKEGFFKKLFSEKKKITNEQFEEYSEDLEMILLENNVALEIAEKLIEEIKEQIVNKELSKKEIETAITNTLEEKIKEVLVEPFDILKEIKEKKEGPYTILFCGINGAGKTTTIAKIASLLKNERISSVMGAGDTFRAASIEQLKKHGEMLKVPVIVQQYGSDPAAVAYDTIKYAKKNKIQVALIDTAGRMHTAKNLLMEMEKIKRVAKPDRTIFLGEAITGNDSVDQVRAFDETIGIDGIILSKADIDEKGGTALSVGYITKKPILFLGTGQKYGELEKFNKKEFIKKLGL